MFCYKCGSSVPNQAAFCPNCGTSLSILSDSISDSISQDSQSNITGSSYDNDNTKLPFEWGIYNLHDSTIDIEPDCIIFKLYLTSTKIKDTKIYYSDIVSVTKKRDGTVFRTTITYKVNNKLKEKKFHGKNDATYNAITDFLIEISKLSSSDIQSYVSSKSDTSFHSIQPNTVQSTLPVRQEQEYEPPKFIKDRQIIAEKKHQLEIEREASKTTAKQRKKMNKEQGIACCPKCGSTSIVANKQGFGIGKAITGVALLGTAGLLAGNINSQKLYVTCLNCKHKWKI